MSVDNPELRNAVIRVLEHKTLNKDAAFELIDSYYKAQASKDMAEVIGENLSEDPSRWDSDTGACSGCNWFVEDGSSECPCVLKNEMKAEQRRTAASKGYRVEGE